MSQKRGKLEAKTLGTGKHTFRWRQDPVGETNRPPPRVNKKNVHRGGGATTQTQEEDEME